KEAARRFTRWVTHDVLPALRQTGRYEVPGARERGPDHPPLAHGPQHRADQLVGAGRIFGAALRVARAARMSPARALQTAFDCAKRHAGVDWREELGAADVLDAAADDPAGGVPPPWEGNDAVLDYVADKDVVTVDE